MDDDIEDAQKSSTPKAGDGSTPSSSIPVMEEIEESCGLRAHPFVVGDDRHDDGAKVTGMEGIPTSETLTDIALPKITMKRKFC